MVSLLHSQFKSGSIDSPYWAERLDDLGRLLEQISEDWLAGDHHVRLAALYEVSRALGSSLDLETVLNQVMDAIIELTGAERGFLMLVNHEANLAVKVARNLDKQQLDDDEFSISHSVISMVMEEGQAVVTTNASDDPRFADQASVITHGLRSIQCVPLRIRGDIIGVIYVDNRVRAGVFDKDDLDILMTFATQAAMAIENARLFTMTDESLARRVEELSMLQEIDQQLNETLDFGKTMSITLEWATQVTGADNGAIALINLDEGNTQVVAQIGNTPADATSLLSIESVNADAGHLAVPIQREGRVIGVITLDREDHEPFSFEAQDMVLRLADHAAIAIENARLYQVVKQANEAKSEFVSVMTHELRIPMTSIKGYAEMLGLVGELTEQQQSFIEIIQNNVIRMSHQVSDLSDISRIESGRLKIEIEDDINLAESIDQVVQTLRQEIEAREHTLNMTVPEDLPTIQADPQRVIQIITNLLSNAYKYTPNGGIITVSASCAGGYVWCEVTDTGIGMTEEDIAHLFNKFWRARDQHVLDQPGTGLGLTITKNLVEMQGGKLTVQSKKGEGSTFAFALPVSS
nr:GAF domain-containing protein [Anaerolineae bacterium]